MIVIKIGGGAEIDHEAILRDLKRQLDGGERAVVIHGANHEMKIISEQLGKPPRMITSVSGYESRYTDAETIEIFNMVYAGKVNTMLVALAHRLGINAVGLSGVDGGLLRGPRKKALKVVENGKRMIIRDDHSGRIEDVNVDLLRTLLDAGYTPLISPPALSDEGEPINVDGDRAAACIAAALGADRLIILSNVPGLLRDKDDESTLIDRVDRRRMDEFETFAEGRMKKKTMGAAEAIDQGVGEVIFADARIDDPIEHALRHEGTVIS
ncbi:MAG: [LysW]-aminoadipate kinase [Phycisphaerales bacterium]|nr:[LysW]-aminoadipate kinase [Phycisphaerales bacterium]NNM26802.1 [LysW]-aminoadipate kinase [Phycisphaerales bacterium]